MKRKKVSESGQQEEGQNPVNAKQKSQQYDSSVQIGIKPGKPDTQYRKEHNP